MDLDDVKAGGDVTVDLRKPTRGFRVKLLVVPLFIAVAAYLLCPVSRGGLRLVLLAIFLGIGVGSYLLNTLSSPSRRVFSDTGVITHFSFGRQKTALYSDLIFARELCPYGIRRIELIFKEGQQIWASALHEGYMALRSKLLQLSVIREEHALPEDEKRVSGSRHDRKTDG